MEFVTVLAIIGGIIFAYGLSLVIIKLVEAMVLEIRVMKMKLSTNTKIMEDENNFYADVKVKNNLKKRVYAERRNALKAKKLELKEAKKVEKMKENIEEKFDVEVNEKELFKNITEPKADETEEEIDENQFSFELDNNTNSDETGEEEEEEETENNETSDNSSEE